MPLEKTFREHSTGLRRLRERVRELRVTVVEDRPSRNDAAIVDNFEYAVEDLTGWLDEALEAAKEAEAAVGEQGDLNLARRSLTACQERFRRIEKVFSTNLVSYERMKDLASFGSERRGEWPSWVATVKLGIEHCRKPLDESRNALAECWQELAERAGGTSVSVRTTNIGQQITAPADAAAGEEWVKRGAT
jgi:hypothetical protein